MNEDNGFFEIKKEILDEIIAHETIIISRHIRPDGDAVGSTLGLARILRISFPGKRVFIDSEDRSEFTAFIGDEGEKPSDADYEGALLIVVDTGTKDRISNDRLELAEKIIKIDHHMCDESFGGPCWIEPDRSAACEMIVDFRSTFKDVLKLDKEAAACLYTGLVTDSGRFKYRGTDANTLRAAAELLETGIDTETIYANLYISDIDEIRFHANIIKMVQLTENGVAWVKITRRFRKRNKLTLEEASNIVNELDSIRGSLIWIAFIENDDGSTRVRLRSRFAEVQELASHYHGGGHACASGATVYSPGEERALLEEADAYLKNYKAGHTGWL